MDFRNGQETDASRFAVVEFDGPANFGNTQMGTYLNSYADPLRVT